MVLNKNDKETVVMFSIYFLVNSHQKNNAHYFKVRNNQKEEKEESFFVVVVLQSICEVSLVSVFKQYFDSGESKIKYFKFRMMVSRSLKSSVKCGRRLEKQTVWPN